MLQLGWSDHERRDDPVRCCKSQVLLREFGNVEGELMASQSIVYPGEPLSAEPNPHRCDSVYPKLDYAKQSWIGVNLDMEERKLAEFYLEEAQRLARMGSWAWQVGGGDALHLSEEWYRIYGFDPKKGMPRWEERLQRVHPEDRDKWRGTIERAIRERSGYDFEYRILLPDGTVKWVHAVGHPVLNAAGELVQFLGSSMDVTEQRQLMEALRKSE